MSFREKSAWISFVTILVVSSAYFWNLGRLLNGDVDRHTGYLIQVVLLGAFVLLEVVLHIAVAMQSPNEARAPKDERERLIEMRATRVAYPVLMIGAFASIGLTHITSSAWIVAQHVLLAIAFAALVKFGLQILYYRRGV